MCHTLHRTVTIITHTINILPPNATGTCVNSLELRGESNKQKTNKIINDTNSLVIFDQLCTQTLVLYLFTKMDIFGHLEIFQFHKIPYKVSQVLRGGGGSAEVWQMSQVLLFFDVVKASLTFFLCNPILLY